MRNRAILLAFALLVSISATASAQGTPPFVRTVIVNSGGTPIANGVALQAALASIVTNSATNPWLVKVEPGIFDLNGGRLTVKNFVDIEGSGRNSTFITSNISALSLNGATVYVPAGIDAEVRELTVRNNSPSLAVGIRNLSSELKLTKVNIEISAGNDAIGFATFNSNPRLSAVFSRVSTTGGEATGVLISGGGPIINELFAFIATPGAPNIGIVVDNGASPIIEGASTTITGGLDNFGLVVRAGSLPKIANGRYNAIGGGRAFGIFVEGNSSTEIKDVTASGSIGNTSAGLVNDGGTVFVSESLLRGSILAPGTFGYGLYNTPTAGQTFANQSTLEGVSAGVFVDGGSAGVGASQVSGGALFLPGSLTCAATYSASYTALNATCL